MINVHPFPTFDDALIWQARRFLFVREKGLPNRGFWVEWFQRFTGNAPGDSWCASFVSAVLAISCEGKYAAPITTTAVCQEIHQQAWQNGWLTDRPTIGDVFLYVDAVGHAHHTGFVTGLAPLTGIAGNTSENGTSSNGDRVAEHPLRPTTGTVKFVHYPRPLTDSGAA